MGKYALLLVAGFSVAGAKVLFSSQETDVKSSQGQSEYDADLIAREIARSAYNAAVADANLKGSDVPAALAAVGRLVTSSTRPLLDKCANGVAECYRREGAMQGGTYRVEASVNGGNGVDIYARGRYDYTTVQDSVGRPRYGQYIRRAKTYEVNEMRSVGVLQVGRPGTLSIQFVDSQAGYCSAIFLKRTLPGVRPEDQPEPEMVYAPGKNRPQGDRNAGYETVLAPGTQMNFGIAVDFGTSASSYDCHEKNKGRPARFPGLRMFDANTLLATLDPAGLDANYGAKLLAVELARYDYAESDWNWVHWALDSGSLDNGNPQEAPWGMVETDQNNNQRWRIAFEDIHNWNLPATSPNYLRPRSSLWATKRFGYDMNNDGVGDGWKDVRSSVITPLLGTDGKPTGKFSVNNRVTGSDGFHDLEDNGSWPDFSDQVIFVQIKPIEAPRVPA